MDTTAPAVAAAAQPRPLELVRTPALDRLQAAPLRAKVALGVRTSSRGRGCAAAAAAGAVVSMSRRGSRGGHECWSPPRAP